LKAIIDTHTLIWIDQDPAKLSPAALAHFNDPTCEILLSVASIWEIVVKLATGKLALSGEVDQVIREIQAQNPLQILPITYDHVLAVRSLSSIHKDPFDRMLVAQAQVEQAVLLSCDPMIAKYPVTVIW
jgi:PIN domain nuclease of toxin-antitoxin system